MLLRGRARAARPGAPRHATGDDIGFGKAYPEFWINLRAHMRGPEEGSGSHVALRARSAADVDAFHAAALAAGGRCDGPPGLRPHDRVNYYAAFVADPDGNRIEAVTFPG